MSDTDTTADQLANAHVVRDGHLVPQGRASQPLDPAQAPEGQPEQQPTEGPATPGPAPVETPQPQLEPGQGG